ncbi:MAG: MarR family transcriptional regulator [Sphingomonas sp.]|nr:MAG: MarR family transcriptional regulator [Sphingomonas sp.]
MPAISDLTDHTGYLLRMVSNAVSHTFASRVADEGVTVAEWVMLRTLYSGEPSAPTVLARKMGMTKGAISKLADRLLEKGLIERASNPDDKRGHSLSLSAAGAKKVPVIARLADENDAAFFAGLSREEHEGLRATLHALITRCGLSEVPVD